MSALDDEIERRELIASLQGGATPTEPNPAGPVPTLESLQGGSVEAPAAPPSLMEVQAGAADIETPGMQDSVRAGLRGATMGLSDAAGAAVASLPNALKQLQPRQQGPGFSETYKDIKGAIDYEADQAMEANPEVMGGLEIAGALAAPAALSGALAARGAKALGMGSRAAKGARGAAAAAKPRMRGTAAQLGEDLAQGAAKPQGLFKSTANIFKGTGKGAVEGAVIDLALGEDMDPVQGAKAGASLGAFKEFISNTPAGRHMWLKLGRRLGGGKLAESMWQAQNPRNQKVIQDMFNAIFRKGAK